MSINLGALLQTAFQTLEGSVENVVRVVLYRSAGDQEYDPATGKSQTRYTDHTVRAIFPSSNRREREADFQSSRRVGMDVGEQRCLIQFRELPIAVTMEDVILEAGKLWRVVDYRPDPTGQTLHTFVLRSA